MKQSTVANMAHVAYPLQQQSGRTRRCVRVHPFPRGPMGHGPEHHLESAEHAHHASLDPFDRRVAMTMAIIVAALACVTMLSHRAHNETLRLQAEANNKHTQASDDWNFYQAKNIRSHEFQAFLLSDMLARKAADSSPEPEQIRGYWIGQIDKYEGKGYWSAFAA